MRSIRKQAVLAAASSLFVCGVALADGDGGDNGMSPYYGDSWADLQAHTNTMPSPAMQALQDRADAQAAFAQARERAHASVERWRDRVGRMLHPDAAAPTG